MVQPASKRFLMQDRAATDYASITEPLAVKLAGNQTIGGLKDFATSPTVNGQPIGGGVAGPPGPTVYIDVKSYGAIGNGIADDTGAIRSAVSAVPAAGGTVFFPPGTYLCRNIRPGRSNITFKGNNATLLYLNDGVNIYDSILGFGDDGVGGSISTSTNWKNILVEDLTFRGLSDSLGHSEFECGITFAGVSDAVVNRCRFIGSQGDGIAINMTIGLGVERHNERISITNCFFDGLNKLGRNAITISEGTDILIGNNYITRTTAPNMPGGIDIEPNNTAADQNVLLKNIIIRGNRFNDVGGNVGDITLFIPHAMTVPPQGLIIQDNIIVNSKQNAISLNWMGAAGGQAATPMKIKIVNNIIDAGPLLQNVGQAISMYSVSDVLMEGNTIYNWGNNLDVAVLGGTSQDFLIQCNKFINCSGNTRIFNIGDVANVVIQSNVVTKTGVVLDNFVALHVGNTNSKIMVLDNYGSGVTNAATNEGATTTAASNYCTGNIGMAKGSGFTGVRPV